MSIVPNTTRGLPRRYRAAVALVILQLATAGQAMGQSSQYIPPGSLAALQPSAAERVAAAAERAPWRWGALRVEPRLSLRSLGYSENVFALPDGEEATADISAAAGAGLAAYVKLGASSYFSTFVTPEYTWWRDLEDLRELNVNYGAGLFGNFNRVQLTARGSSSERERPLSSESEVPVQVLQEEIALETRVELRPRLALVGVAAAGTTRYTAGTADELASLRLDELGNDTQRIETLLALGLRNGLEIGLGVERLETDFPVDPGERSNTGTSPVVRLSYEGPRILFDTRVLSRDVEFDNQTLGRFEKETGSALFRLDLASKTQLSLYGASDLVYGVAAVASTIDDSRWGSALARRLGSRTQATVYLERGTARYRDMTGPNASRRDELEAFGANVSLEIGRRTRLALRFSEVRYDSNLPEFDRSTTRFGLGLEFDEDLLPW